MSGRLSALWNIVNSIPYIIGACASGWMAENIPPRQIFVLMAIGSVLIALSGFWKPRAVFDQAYDQQAVRGSDLVGDIKKLMRHRAIYPAILLMFLFQFSPAQNTPFQFYLTDTLHGSDAIYGYFSAISSAAFIPMFFVYGYLCKRVRLGKLLWWGIVITVPSLAPILFVHSLQTALWAAIPIGMLGGIAAGAIYDLAMRSCPPGMQGTLMMMIDSAEQLSYRGGDLLGSTLYNASPSNGFLYCMLATTGVYACMRPVILLVPKELRATADGDAPAA